MKSIVTVFLKEVRENLRDRRTLMSALVIAPLVGPLMMVIILSATINHRLDKKDKPLRVPVIGARYAPDLVRALKQYGLVAEPPIRHPEAAVRQQLADVVLRIPASYSRSWNQGETAQVEVIYDASQMGTDTSVNRLKGMLRRYDRSLGNMRLQARGLTATTASPILAAPLDQSTPQSRAGKLFSIMIAFFMMGVFIGGMYLAIDLTAGERERQSLEPLLVNPVSRWKVLLGKLGATAAFATVSLLLSLLAFGLATLLIPTGKIGMTLSLGPSFLWTVVLVMLPLIALAAALETLVSSFAKSYREAQNHLQMVLFLPMLVPILLSAMPIRAVNWMYAVPLLGQQLAITDLLRGDAVSPMHVALILLGGFSAAAIAVAVTVRVYASERLAISD